MYNLTRLSRRNALFFDESSPMSPLWRFSSVALDHMLRGTFADSSEIHRGLLS
jgi:hypothetical protein